jgi:hypothetical protein
MKNIGLITLFTGLILASSSVFGAHASDWDTLISALETANLSTVQAIIPGRIDVNATTRGLSPKTPVQIARYWLEKRAEVIRYLHSATSAKTAAASSIDWDNLLPAIEKSDLSTISAIVPSKISPWDTTRGGRKILAIAQYHLDQQAQIATYLESIGESRAGEGGDGAAMPASSPKEIRFYHRTDPYYEFTNFYSHPITIDGAIWPTSEHYFQAQKFVKTPRLMAVICTGRMSCSDVFAFARANEVHKRADWETLVRPGVMVKDDIMWKVLDAKFAPGTPLAELLKSTGTAMLIEASDVDHYWGWGPADPRDGNHYGQNRLGEMLMALRARL